MSAPAVPKLMTTEELLAMPDDGVERYLIRGQLREVSAEEAMTRRNRRHCRSTTKLAKLLDLWLDNQPVPRGEVLTGEAGFRLCHDPDTTVGIDLAYISAALSAQSPDNAGTIDGIPILAVEILSPSVTHEELVEKLQDYLQNGVPVVWIVDPDLRTVTVHRPGMEPEMFNARQELSGEPELPSFRVPVADLFAR
jgi:Uma2 family endonuclease